MCVLSFAVHSLFEMAFAKVESGGAAFTAALDFVESVPVGAMLVRIRTFGGNMKSENLAVVQPCLRSDGERRLARALLMERFEIKSEFVRVDLLAKVLGLSSSTIYGHMRVNKFCMPFRRVGTTPIVKLDHLVEWYCDAERDDCLVSTAGSEQLEKSYPYMASTEEDIKTKRSKELFEYALKHSTKKGKAVR